MLGNFIEAAESIIGAALSKKTKCKSVMGAGGLVCGLGAVNYLAKKTYHSILPKHYAAVENVILLGISGNDCYDTGRFDKDSYLKIRRQLTANADLSRSFCEYHFALAKLEKNRPIKKDGIIPTPDSIIKYREDVNAVSLQIVFAAAGINNQNIPQLESLYKSVMALQVADDMAGWRGVLVQIDQASIRHTLGTVCREKTY